MCRYQCFVRGGAIVAALLYYNCLSSYSTRRHAPTRIHPIPEYCTATDVQNRLTANGYLNLADRDGDGEVNSDEVDAYINAAIEWAGSEIDYALINHQPPYALEAARSSGNIFLRSRAVDFAAWQVATNGGRDVPDSFQAAYERAVEMLDGIRERGDEVPGLTNGTATWNENSHQAFEIQSEGVT